MTQFVADRRYQTRDASRMSYREIPGSAGELRFYPIVFESPSEDLGGWREIIGRDVIERAIAGADLRAVYNHDTAALLGRQSSGTLTVSVDERGLLWVCQLPDTTTGRDVAELWRRGDILGGSFQFSGGEWRREGDADGLPLYRLVAIEQIWEAGPVTFPAYRATELSSRARAIAQSEPASGGQGPFGPAPEGGRSQVLRVTPADCRRALGSLDLQSFLPKLEKALRDLLMQEPWSLEYWWYWYISSIYDDSVVVFDSQGGRYLQVPYTVQGVEIQLGTPVEVVARWEPVTVAAEGDTSRRLRHQALLVPGHYRARTAVN